MRHRAPLAHGLKFRDGVLFVKPVAVPKASPAAVAEAFDVEVLRGRNQCVALVAEHLASLTHGVVVVVRRVLVASLANVHRLPHPSEEPDSVRAAHLIGLGQLRFLDGLAKLSVQRVRLNSVQPVYLGKRVLQFLFRSQFYLLLLGLREGGLCRLGRYHGPHFR